MGSRLFKRWFALPLKQVQTINDRHNVVSWFLDKRTSMEDAVLYQKSRNLERLITKVAVCG